MRSLSDAPIKKGTRVILRADFDVPLKNGKVADDFRIRETLPTVQYVLKKGGLLRIISHLGRPGGKKKRGLSLLPVARYLERILKRRGVFMSDWIDRTDWTAKTYPEILLFENLRFFPGEEKNDFAFVSRLAELGDIYVNEAFANSHRAHASMEALARLRPSFAGLRLEKEINALDRVLTRFRRPLIAVLGGVKLETKLPVIRRFLKIADKILLGGELANEFLSGRARIRSRKILLPADGLGVYGAFKDIGPETIERFVSVLGKARTVVWNGPLGIAENPKFTRGTKAVARALARSKAFTVVGGGDTIAALRKYGLLDGFSHVSIGGGAMLEFLAGKKLPGIEALKSDANMRMNTNDTNPLFV